MIDLISIDINQAAYLTLKQSFKGSKIIQK